MAKAFAPPEEVGDFEFDFSNYDHNKYDAAETTYTARLKAALPKYSKTPEDPIVGEIVRTPRADGYAQYLVLSTRPLELVHLPVGDAWRADPAWIRGLRLSDVRKMIEDDKELHALFS